MLLLMNEEKPSVVPKVFSIITLVIGVLSFICAIIVILISVFGTERGGISTALTNKVVLFITGQIIFTVAVWVLGIIGEIVAFISLIVDIAAKSAKYIWMPIVTMVMGIVSIIMSAAVY